MIELNGAIGVLATVLGIIVAVAAVAAFARASFAKAQIEALRGDRDDLKVRVDRLEHDLEIAQADARTERSKVEVLERVVTGSDAIEAVHQTMMVKNQSDAAWQAEQRALAERIEALLVQHLPSLHQPPGGP